jgi:hypothetical protein
MSRKKKPLPDWTVVRETQQPDKVWALGSTAFIPVEKHRFLKLPDDQGTLIEFYLERYGVTVRLQDIPVEMQESFLQAINSLHASRGVLNAIVHAAEQMRKKAEPDAE